MSRFRTCFFHHRVFFFISKGQHRPVPRGPCTRGRRSDDKAHDTASVHAAFFGCCRPCCRPAPPPPPGVSDVTEQNLAAATEPSLHFRTCGSAFGTRITGVNLSVRVCVCVWDCSAVYLRANVAPSDSSLLCQEIRTPGEPLAR